MKRRLGNTVFLVPALVFAAIGCKQEAEILAYDAPKERRPTPVAHNPAAGMVPHGHGHAGLTWTTPEGWRAESGEGSMRAATFKAGDEGNALTVTVIRLEGTGGGLLANVNRWRDQLGLEPIEEAQLSEVTRPLTDGHVEGVLVDLTADEPEVPGQPLGRMLVGVFPYGGGTWFFKAQSVNPRIKEHEAAFLQLLRSVRPEESSVAESPSSPPADAPSPKPTTSPAVAGLQPYDAGLVRGMVPATWRPSPPSSTRVASFVVGQGDQRAEAAVTRFPGDVGGELANVNRWRRQAGLGPLSDAAEQKSRDVEIGGKPGKLYHIAANDAAGNQPRILVASVRVDDHTWFFKLSGPSDLIQTQIESFVKFILSTEFVEDPDA